MLDTVLLTVALSQTIAPFPEPLFPLSAKMEIDTKVLILDIQAELDLQMHHLKERCQREDDGFLPGSSLDSLVTVRD